MQLIPFGPRSRSYECAVAAGRRRGGRCVEEYDGAVRCGVWVGVAVGCLLVLPARVCFASGDRWLFAVCCWLLACFGRDDARDGREGYDFAKAIK